MEHTTVPTPLLRVVTGMDDEDGYFFELDDNPYEELDFNKDITTDYSELLEEVFYDDKDDLSEYQ